MPVENQEKYYPHAVALEITLACNMRCLHCGSAATGVNRKNALKLEDWKKVIDDLRTLESRTITLSGGEPFLYKHWRELIAYICKDNKMQASVITNGVCITEDDVIYMKQKGVSHIAISLDGDSQTHDYIRQYPGAFKRIMQTIKYCQKHDLKFAVVTSINQINFKIRNNILLAVLNHKIKNWQIQIVNSFGRAGDNKDTMQITHEQYIQLVDDIAKWQKIYSGQVRIMPADSIGYCHPVTDEMLEGAEWQGCNAGMYVLGIEANGNVKGCLSLQDDYFNAGNVKNRSLVDIWNDDSCFAYTRGYDSSKMKGACKNCEKASQCQAGCLAIAHSVHGSIHENSYCYKSIIEKLNNTKAA